MSNNSRIHLHYFVVCTALSAFTAAPCSAELPFTTVHKFNGTDGDSPQSGLSVLGTSLYGTTNAWGANGYGTLFSVSTLDQTFAKLHDFSPPAEGYLSARSMTPLGSKLYGTAFNGGTDNAGTVFGFDTTNNTLATLYMFSGSEQNGAYPACSLLNVGPVFYGLTQGLHGFGTVFTFNPATQFLSTIHKFSNSDGARPFGNLTLVGGRLYGTTYIGGPSGGTIFSIDPSNNTFATVHNFSASEGARPQGNLVAIGTKLYGTTQGNSGTIFSFDPVSGTLTTEHTFLGANGADPAGTLATAGSMLFGTTSRGGAANMGTAYSFDTSSGLFATLHSFTGDDGATPYSGLSLLDSTLYGTTWSGGLGHGTIFAIQIPEPSCQTLLLFGIAVVTAVTTSSRAAQSLKRR